MLQWVISQGPIFASLVLLGFWPWPHFWVASYPLQWVRSSIDWLARPYAFNYGMNYVIICCFIGLVWQSRVGLKQWSMAFKLHQMSTLTGGLQVDVVNAFNSILSEAIFQELRVVKGQLFILFLFVSSFYCQQLPLSFSHHSPCGELFIILLFMGTHQGDSFIGPIFVLAHFGALQFHLLFFFFCVSSFCWQTTFASSTLLPLFPLFLAILLPSWPLWVCMFNFTSVMFGPLLVCPLIFLPLIIFATLQATLKF